MADSNAKPESTHKYYNTKFANRMADYVSSQSGKGADAKKLHLIAKATPLKSGTGYMVDASEDIADVKDVSSIDHGVRVSGRGRFMSNSDVKALCEAGDSYTGENGRVYMSFDASVVGDKPRSNEVGPVYKPDARTASTNKFVHNSMTNGKSQFENLEQRWEAQYSKEGTSRELRAAAARAEAQNAVADEKAAPEVAAPEAAAPTKSDELEI